MRMENMTDIKLLNEEGSQADSPSIIPLFTLPSELLVLIISSVDEKDILELRQTCLALYWLINENQATIARNILSQNSAYSSRCTCHQPLLSAQSDHSTPSLKTIYALLRSENLISRLCDMIADFAQGRMDLQTHELEQFQVYRAKIWKTSQSCFQHLFSWLLEYRAEFVATIEREESVDHPAITRRILERWKTGCVVECYCIVKIIAMIVKYSMDMTSMPDSYRISKGTTEPLIPESGIVKCLLFGGWDVVAEIICHDEKHFRYTMMNTFLGSIDSYSCYRRPIGLIRSLQIFSSFKKSPLPLCLSNTSSTYIYTSTSPTTSTLPLLDCSLLPKLSPQTTAKMLRHLRTPTWEKLFLYPAEKSLFGTKPLQGTHDMVKFANWITSRRPESFIVDFLMMDPANESIERGTNDSDTGSWGPGSTVSCHSMFPRVPMHWKRFEKPMWREGFAALKLHDRGT